MTFLDLFIISFAVFRLTRLLTKDSIFEAFRDRLWSKYPPETSKIGYLLTCGWCLSIWVGSLFYLSSTIAPEATRIVSTILALSAVSGLLAAYEEK